LPPQVGFFFLPRPFCLALEPHPPPPPFLRQACVLQVFFFCVRFAFSRPLLHVVPSSDFPLHLVTLLLPGFFFLSPPEGLAPSTGSVFSYARLVSFARHHILSISPHPTNRAFPTGQGGCFRGIRYNFFFFFPLSQPSFLTIFLIPWIRFPQIFHYMLFSLGLSELTPQTSFFLILMSLTRTLHKRWGSLPKPWIFFLVVALSFVSSVARLIPFTTNFSLLPLADSRLS